MIIMVSGKIRLIDLKRHMLFLAGRFDGRKIRSNFFEVHFQSSPSFLSSLS